jgi:peptidoglycan/LPS O-acetylase OafA/YrhL
MSNLVSVAIQDDAQPTATRVVPDHGRNSSFRTDIEGLRGVAILLVILFHVGLSRFAGGYVGVDVFFVISGFLITKQLYGQISVTGRISLREFWAGRLRRLMPLLSLTVAATMSVSLLVYSPLNWGRIADDATASITYTSNLLSARKGEPYFSSSTSPFLHMWSLGVEEQFYIGWPLVLLAVGLLVRRRGWRFKRVVTAVVVAGTALSFLFGWGMTRRRSPWAFYGSPTRAWEFGLGALAFLVGPAVRKLPTIVRAAASWLGLIAVCGSAVAFDNFTPMPGTSALVPVLGTAALICLETTSRWSVSCAVLELRPLRSLGRVSYAWYLFHWPAIVLLEAATDRTGVATDSVACVGALALAYAGTRWIERPVRQSGRLKVNRVVYATSLSVVIVILAGAIATNWETARQLRDPYLANLALIRKRSYSASGNCAQQVVAPDLSTCVYGPSDGRRLIMIVGDSHAGQWAQTIEAATNHLHDRFITRSHNACSAYDVFEARPNFNVASKICLRYRDETFRLIRILQPDLVILSNRDYSEFLLQDPSGGPLDGPRAAAAYASARTRFAALVRDAGAKLAVIGDVPTQPRDPIECLAFHRSAMQCSSRSTKIVPIVESRWQVEEATLAAVAPVTYFDLLPLICDAEICSVERDGIVVYSDESHLSSAFTAAQTAAIENMITSSIG